MTAEPRIAISALEHHLYCPRQCALIHLDGVWADNRHTIRGHRGHRRVDQGRDRWERGRLVLRGIPLWSEQYGLTGRADAVEIGGDGTPVPIEYKIGRRHGKSAEVQVTAQALCLEEMTGAEISRGFVWYSGPRRRQAVDIDQELRSFTAAAIDEVRTMLRGVDLPNAVDDARCTECQLVGHCLPAVVADSGRARDYVAEVLSCDS